MEGNNVQCEAIEFCEIEDFFSNRNTLVPWQS